MLKKNTNGQKIQILFIWSTSLTSHLHDKFRELLIFLTTDADDHIYKDIQLLFKLSKIPSTKVNILLISIESTMNTNFHLLLHTF